MPRPLALQTEPPASDGVTPYDRAHATLYMRLLDAAREGADWREAVRVLFNRDPEAEPEICRRMHDSHLARARWMTEHGYKLLLRHDQES